MKLGNKLFFFSILFLCVCNFSFAEDKITSTPLINLEEIKPSFDGLSEENEKLLPNQNIKKKRNQIVL